MTQTIGRYQLVGRLGQGGMAEIFLARLRGPGGVEKNLVVKRIRKAVSRDPRFVNLFLHEAKLSMSLGHKNIVPVFDFGRAGGELFLVMEHVPGFDLGRALTLAADKDVPLPPILAAYIGSEACQGLGSAHRKGAVHRDVTPRNILLSDAGEVKLVDFGIAVGTGTLNDGKVRGTPNYMSPEQAAGDSVDERSDLFSLGLVLWEAVASARAYSATDDKSLIELAREGRVPDLPSSVPEKLRQTIARATAPVRSERFESALEMQSSLEEFIVAERSSGHDSMPLGQRLANWLQVIGAGEARPEETIDENVSGEVVTFLEDGADAVAAATKIETIIASDTAELAPAAPAPPVAPPLPAQRRWLVPAAAVILVSAALVVWGLGDRERSSSAPPPTRTDAGESTQAVIAIDAATPAPDATPPTPDAAPPPDATRPSKHGERDAAAPKTNLAMGSVEVSSTPWARVTVSKRKESCEDTPCRLQLPEGSYVLVLENPVAGSRKTVKVEVKAEKTSTVRVDLTPPLP